MVGDVAGEDPPPRLKETGLGLVGLVVNVPAVSVVRVGFVRSIIDLSCKIINHCINPRNLF